MFVAASTHSFGDRPLAAACDQLVELEYDKVEFWLSEAGDHLKPSEVAADPERWFARIRETTRLTPIAVSLHEDVAPGVLQGMTKWAKMLKVAQISIPASPLGTPFNTEIDRLREAMRITSEDGVRLSLKTRPGTLTEDPHTAVELCQSVKGLGLTLDPGCYLRGSHSEQTVDQLFPYVFHVSLRDSTAEELQVPTGLGEVDYSRLIVQLQRTRYNLALCVELLPELSGGIDRQLEMRKLRMLLDTLL